MNNGLIALIIIAVVTVIIIIYFLRKREYFNNNNTRFNSNTRRYALLGNVANEENKNNIDEEKNAEELNLPYNHLNDNELLELYTQLKMQYDEMEIEKEREKNTSKLLKDIKKNHKSIINNFKKSSRSDKIKLILHLQKHLEYMNSLVHFTKVFKI